MDTAFGPSGLFLSTSQCARLVIGVMVTGQCVQSITLPGPPVTILSVRGHQAGQSINTVTGTVTIPCTVGSSPPPCMTLDSITVNVLQDGLLRSKGQDTR